MRNFPGINNVCTEALINGVKVRFDAQSTGDLRKAKLYYREAFKYIGTTDTVFYNGIESSEKCPHHIFIYK